MSSVDAHALVGLPVYGMQFMQLSMGRASPGRAYHCCHVTRLPSIDPPADPCFGSNAL